MTGWIDFFTASESRNVCVSRLKCPFGKSQTPKGRCRRQPGPRDRERIEAQGSLPSRPILMASGVSSAPPKGNVAPGSLSSLAAFPPRRGWGGAVRGNSDDPVGGEARIRTAGKAAGPKSGPCATRPNPQTTMASRTVKCRFRASGSHSRGAAALADDRKNSRAALQTYIPGTDVNGTHTWVASELDS